VGFWSGGGQARPVRLSRGARERTAKSGVQKERSRHGREGGNEIGRAGMLRVLRECRLGLAGDGTSK
jgi:hypothetical protein